MGHFSASYGWRNGRAISAPNLQTMPITSEAESAWRRFIRGTPVAGASSYTVYRGGIEIEIDTRVDFRRQGLATACGARLILDCLDCGLYPSWDAHSRASLALSKKLGYKLDRPYPAYEWNPGLPRV